MDPVQAANVALTVWQMLHAASEGQTDVDPKGERRAPEDVPPESFERRYAEMQERLDRLVLAVHAMWTLIAEKTGITEAELLKRMTELDGADGAVDGQVTMPPVTCSCGAVVCRKLGRCLFCGKPYAAGSAFDTL